MRIILSGFEAVTRLGQCVEPAPYEAIDGHDCGSHQDGGSEEQIEVAAVGGLTDGGAEASGGVDVALEVEVLGYDARIPCAAGCRHQASHQVGKDAWQDQLFPALDPFEPENRAALLQVRRDRDCACDDVKQDVPLRP